MVSTLKLALADAGETKYCHRNDYLDDTYSTVYLKLTPHPPVTLLCWSYNGKSIV